MGKHCLFEPQARGGCCKRPLAAECFGPRLEGTAQCWLSLEHRRSDVVATLALHTSLGVPAAMRRRQQKVDCKSSREKPELSATHEAS